VAVQELGGHAIKILGWGVMNNVDYWIVANSWNPDWGLEGFFLIRRGTDEVRFGLAVVSVRVAALTPVMCDPAVRHRGRLRRWSAQVKYRACATPLLRNVSRISSHRIFGRTVATWRERF
jgi:hypothetical protein